MIDDEIPFILNRTSIFFTRSGIIEFYNLDSGEKILELGLEQTKNICTLYDEAIEEWSRHDEENDDILVEYR